MKSMKSSIESFRTKLRRIGHSGIIAAADGTPIMNGENWIRAAEAYDIGGVATGLKPVSMVSLLDVDGTLGTACSLGASDSDSNSGTGQGIKYWNKYWNKYSRQRRRLALEALRLAEARGAMYIPAARAKQGSRDQDVAIVYLPKNFETAAGLSYYYHDPPPQGCQNRPLRGRTLIRVQKAGHLFVLGGNAGGP